MTGTVPDSGRWAASGGSLQVEYAQAVLEEIRRAAVQELSRFRHGGLEVGGLLLGSSENGLTRITAHQPVISTYAAGPSFRLSTEEDLARFDRAGRDAVALGQQPVGWYVSHTRTALEPRAEDIEVHDRFFPDPGEVLLVLRPEPFGSAAACFFARDAEGRLQTAPTGAFQLQAPARTPRPASAPAGEQSPAPDAPSDAPSARHSAPEQRPAPARAAEPQSTPRVPPPWYAGLDDEDRTTPWYRRWPVYALGSLALALLVMAGLTRLRVNDYAPLGLKATPLGDQIEISWNHSAPAVLEAERGTVEIRDGVEQIAVPLTHDKLLRGYLAYTPRSDDVQVRLRVFRAVGPGVEELVRHIGPGALRARAPAMDSPQPAPDGTPQGPRTDEPGDTAASAELPPAPEVKPPPPPTAAPARREEERAQERERSEPTRTVSTPQPTPTPALSRPTPTPAPPRPTPTPVEVARNDRPPARAFDPSGLNRPTEQPTRPLPTPPPVSANPGVQGRPAPSTALVQLPAPPAPSRVLERRPTPAPPKPQSGRIIWTGQLPGNGALAITGARASTGELTGSLPGYPVRISVRAAELTSGGLRVYAASPGEARAGSEPARAENGWNRTSYVWEEGRAQNVLVTAAPSAENGWRGLALRGNGDPVSVVIIDWHAVGEQP